jgi:four helix bundle protein
MLRIYGVMLEVLKTMRPVLAAIETKDRDLARQARRAGTSVVLNLAEGTGARGGTRRQRYSDALGSAREFRGCLDSALALGYVGQVESEGLREVIGSLVKLTR